MWGWFDEWGDLMIITRKILGILIIIITLLAGIFSAPRWYPRTPNIGELPLSAIFGRTTTGASSVYIDTQAAGGNGSFTGGSFTPAYSGTAVNMTAALKRSGGSANDQWHIKIGIYFDSNFSRLAYVTDDTPFNLTTTFANYTFTTWTGTPQIYAGTPYMLVVYGINYSAAGRPLVAYSATSTANQGHLATSGFTDPYVATTNYTNLFSIFCSYTYTPPGPDYYSPAVKGVGIAHYFAGGTANMTCNWTSVGSYLLNYTLETNNTGHFENATYGFPASTLTWIANVSITLNSSGAQVLAWRSHANITTGGSSSTPWQYWDIWKVPLGTCENNFGYSGGYGLNQIYYNASGTGGKEAIYVAYQNSSFTPWHYEIRAYDLNESLWTASYNVSNMTIGGDGHWAPTISVISVGTELRLCYMQAYDSGLNYTIGLYDVKTTSSLALLTSNWMDVKSYKLRYNDYCYPDAIAFDDRMMVFVRTGTSSLGQTAMIEYNSSKLNNEAIYVGGFNETLNEWTKVGQSPYLNDSFTNYMYLNKLTASYYAMAWFSFDNNTENQYLFQYSDSNSTPFNTTCQVLLQIYVNNSVAADNTQIYWNNWTTNIGTLPTLTNAWYDLNLTSIINSTSQLYGNKIAFNSTGYFGGTGDYHPKISIARLNVTWTGWGKPTVVLTNTTGWTSQYFTTGNNGSNVMLAWTQWDSLNDQENNQYFVYSPDKGATWKNVSGTIMTLPVSDSSTSAKVATVTSRTRSSNPVIDENGLVVLPFTKCDAGIYGRHYDWYLKIAQYSAGLGATGTWTISNAVNQDDEMIFGTSTEASFLTVGGYYNRPSFWTAGNQSDFYVKKYVRLPNNTTKFLEVCTGLSGHKTEMMCNFLIRDSLMSYEQVGIQAWLDVLGVFPSDTHVGNYTEQVSNFYFWGTNFTATATTLITGLQICGNTTIGSGWRIALYHATNGSLIIKSTSSSGLTSGTAGDGWLAIAQFPEPVTIYAGANYYLCFALDVNDAFSYRWDNISSTLNQTFTALIAGGEEVFPATLGDTGALTYYNRTISIVARSSTIVCIGMGSELSFVDFASNSTEANGPCVVSSTISSANGVNGTYVYHNSTGHWTPSAYQNLNCEPTIRANVTFTLNATGGNYVAYYFKANDSANHWRSSNIQYIWLVTNLPIVGWNNFTVWGLDVTHTLAELNTSLVYDGINYSVLVVEYANGTRYELIFGWGGDEIVSVTSDSKLYLLVNVPDEWGHHYG